MNSKAQECVKQAKKTPNCRKACCSSMVFADHMTVCVNSCLLICCESKGHTQFFLMSDLMQGREWMQQMKNAIGPQLLTKKFKRKSGQFPSKPVEYSVLSLFNHCSFIFLSSSFQKESPCSIVKHHVWRIGAGGITDTHWQRGGRPGHNAYGIC